MVAGCGLLVAGNAVVAGCGPPSLFASLGLGWSFEGFVAGELVVEAEAGADEGVVLATDMRPGLFWEKSRAVVQRKTAGKHTRSAMG
jgi:hypothetical protein